MKKNYKNYGPTGLLWALYLIVGVVAFLVSNFYFKFELKDALIFAGINFVGVILFTEGIDFIFKKVKSRKTSEDTEDETVVEEESVADVATETPEDSTDETDTAEPEVEPTVVVPDKVEDETASEDQPVRRRGLFGRRKPAPVVAAEENTEEAETKTEDETSEPEENAAVAVAEDVPVLSPVPDEEPVCFKPGPLAAESVEAPAEGPAEVHAEAPETESETEPVEEQPVRRRGRRANPDAVIDAPTSSIAVITPDMVKPTAEPELVVEHVEEVPVAPEAVVVPEVVTPEPVVEEKSLSAEEFLSTTKLTSPRAIVREYQRLGGKEDIFAVLMERQK